MMRHITALLLSGILIPAATGCGPGNVDLKRDIEIIDVTTGWLDGGIVQGEKNKLQPSASFRIRNRGSRPLTFVQITGVFHRVVDPARSATDTWGDSTIFAIHSDPLQPGQTTGVLRLYSEEGYTGEEPRARMLANSNFRDVQVKLYGKHGASDPVQLGEYPVARKLVGAVPKT